MRLKKYVMQVLLYLSDGEHVEQNVPKALEIFHSIKQKYPMPMDLLVKSIILKNIILLTIKKLLKITHCVSNWFLIMKRKIYVTQILGGCMQMESMLSKMSQKALEIFHSIKQEYPDAYGSIADIHNFEEYNSIDLKKTFENYTLCVELSSDNEKKTDVIIILLTCI